MRAAMSLCQHKKVLGKEAENDGMSDGCKSARERELAVCCKEVDFFEAQCWIQPGRLSRSLLIW